MSEATDNRSEDTQAALRADVHLHRMRRWPSRWRCALLRLALGHDTFDYMLRSIKADRRTPGARMVDIVVRQDGREERIEADWIKTIARYSYHLAPKPYRPSPAWARSLRMRWWRLKCALRYPVSVRGTQETAGDCQQEKVP